MKAAGDEMETLTARSAPAAARNENVDLFRAVSLLMIVVYHAWVLTGGQPTGIGVLDQTILYWGEIGVTAFFLLSGYGIFHSLSRRPVNSLADYRDFLWRRFQRIAPQYYLSLAVVLLLSGGAFFSREGMGSILSHLFFVHNFVPAWHGSINGALWTMGVTVQFYLVAPLLYRPVRRAPFCSMAASVAVTVLVKIFLFPRIAASAGPDASATLLFIYGRQLLTALDNFVAGMAVARCVEIRTPHRKGAALCGFAAGIAALWGLCRWAGRSGLHVPTRSGYLWHSLVALCLAGILLAIHAWQGTSRLPALRRGLLELSRREYAIYVWHLLVIRNLADHSTWVQALCSGRLRLVGIVLVAAVSIAFGMAAHPITEKR